MQINRITQQVTNLFLADNDSQRGVGASFLEIYKAKNKVTILHASNLVIIVVINISS